MPATKRSHDGAEKESSPFMPMFENFMRELDSHHDRRERLIKSSRDVTALSKKMIFSLQRVRVVRGELPDKVAAEVEERRLAIKVLLCQMALDLEGMNAWRYQRQVSPGIQEFVEAISFKHYLKTQKLITHDEVSKAIPEGVELTEGDYALGLYDMTGELMRFAITTMATTGSLPGFDERTILMDLRSLRTYFEALDTTSCNGTGLGKDLGGKIEVMRTCVEKVETAVYGMIIRGRERPKGWVPEIEGDRRGAEESY